MQLEELKNIWTAERKELEHRISITERLVKDLAREKSMNSFRRMISKAIIGRNLALVYMAISIMAGIYVFYDFAYSIPAFIGAVGMLLSFLQHASLKMPDYSSMNTVELQKTIYWFRMHTAKYARYDNLVVSFWYLTILPLHGKHILQLELSILEWAALITMAIILTTIGSIHGYKKWNRQLQENEDQLGQILEFEKS